MPEIILRVSAGTREASIVDSLRRVAPISLREIKTADPQTFLALGRLFVQQAPRQLDGIPLGQILVEVSDATGE